MCSKDLTDLNRALLTAEAAVRKLGGSGVDVPPGTLWWMKFVFVCFYIYFFNC